MDNMHFSRLELLFGFVWPWILPLVWIFVCRKHLLLNWFEDEWLILSCFIIHNYIWCIFLYFKDPWLLKQRFAFMKHDPNQVKHDNLFVKIWGLSLILWWISIPLDCCHFHWSRTIIHLQLDLLEYPFFYTTSIIKELKWFWFFLHCFGMYLYCQSINDCPFASTNIKIITKRDHKVIDHGSYGYIRHPMYSGVCAWVFGITLFLQSFVGFILAIVWFILMMLRIHFEEQILCTQLPGYLRYKQKVRYRFVPCLF